MNFVHTSIGDGIATVEISRGKVNALNAEVVTELHARLSSLADDDEAHAVILTGAGKFFSFGFDIPHFLNYSRSEFSDFLDAFTALYRSLFVFPKPVIAAINGHAIAGGCMIALACDHRLLVPSPSKIGLNEITFGASVFAGIAAMLTFQLGGSRATEILYSGKMFEGEEAVRVGLADEIVEHDRLLARANEIALELGGRDSRTFQSIKLLLRGPVTDAMLQRERRSIEKFVDIWYSDTTRANLEKITIR